MDDADRERRAVRLKSCLFPGSQAPGHPKFVELGERLEKIKERHEIGVITSLEFLKQILGNSQGSRRGGKRKLTPAEERQGQGGAH